MRPRGGRSVDNVSIKCRKLLKRVDNFGRNSMNQPIGGVDNLPNGGGRLWITRQIYNPDTPLVKRSGKIFSKMWNKLPIFAYLCVLNQLLTTHGGATKSNSIKALDLF